MIHDEWDDDNNTELRLLQDSPPALIQVEGRGI